MTPELNIKPKTYDFYLMLLTSAVLVGRIEYDAGIEY